MLVHPVFAGSAITGAGVDGLIAGIRELLPATEGDPDGPVSGAVFKVERGRAGEKIAYVRVFSGTLRARDRLQFGRDRAAKVTAISVFDRGPAVPRSGGRRRADRQALGARRHPDRRRHRPAANGLAASLFAPPTLETVVVPTHASDKGALHAALAQLAEQDPLIDLRQDDAMQEIFVSLYGEVQKEVIQQTLANDFGIDVGFRETTTICIERPVGSGAAFETMGEPPNPFMATVGVRIDPAPANSGIEFRLEVEFGSIPLPFHKAVEDTARQTLRQGLYGWQVTDCTLTMTHSGYSSAASVAADFRNLTPLVVMDALKRAGTAVCEPINHFQLDIPADTLAAVLPLLARLGAVPQISAMRGSSSLLEGNIPAARVHQLQRQLPALTRGEAVLESAFDHYRPMRGTVPTRPRSDYNPLNRKEYMLHLMRRRSNEVLSHDR